MTSFANIKFFLYILPIKHSLLDKRLVTLIANLMLQYDFLVCLEYRVCSYVFDNCLFGESDHGYFCRKAFQLTSVNTFNTILSGVQIFCEVLQNPKSMSREASINIICKYYIVLKRKDEFVVGRSRTTATPKNAIDRKRIKCYN